MKVKSRRVSGERALTKKDLVVHPLSATEWRISDARLPQNDAFSLLGFIERKSDTFEAMQLGRGFEWFSFPTFDAAVEHFLDIDRSDCSAGDHVLSGLPSFV